MKVSVLLILLGGALAVERHTLDFDSQLQNLVKHVRLSHIEFERLTGLFYQFEALLPGVKLHTYGSLVTGLATELSDFDAEVQAPPDGDITRQIATVHDTLTKHPNLYTNFCKSYARGHRILLSFTHKPIGRKCDLNFGSTDGARNSGMLRYYLHADPRTLPLAMALKLWDRNLGMHLRFDLTLMLILYFQQKNLLLPLAQLQKNAQIVDHWYVDFESVPYRSTNNESMYELLGGFFNYYSTFDFHKNVVTIFYGQPVEKWKFINYEQLPSQFELYKYNLMKNITEPLPVHSKFCIQEPFILSEVTHAMTDDQGELMLEHISTAARLYQTTDNQDFLRTLMTQQSPSPTQTHTQDKCQIKD